MRFSILAPGHVVWQSRRARRWLLTGLAAGGLVAALCWPSPPGPYADWWAVVAALALLVAGLGAAAAARTVVELSPRQLRLQRFRPWGNDERTAPRAAAIALRVRATIATVGDAHGAARRMLYCVELAMRGHDLPPSIELRRAADEIAARRVAKDWARAADLPFVDAVGDEIAVRAADAVDLGAASPAALPPGPPPAGIEATAARALELAWLPRRERVRQFACLGTSVLAAAAVVAFAPRELAAAALGLGVALPLTVLAVLAAAHCGRTHLAVERGELHCVHRLFGWPLHRVRIATAGVEQVRLQSGGPGAPHLHPGVAVVARDRVLVLGSALDPAAQQWLRAWLQAQLGSEVQVAAT